MKKLVPILTSVCAFIMPGTVWLCEDEWKELEYLLVNGSVKVSGLTGTNLNKSTWQAPCTPPVRVTDRVFSITHNDSRINKKDNRRYNENIFQ